jgi:hypothetical protein
MLFQFCFCPLYFRESIHCLSMENYTTIFFLRFVFSYNSYFQFFIFLSLFLVFMFFNFLFFDPYFFSSNFYIFFYSNDYFSFVNFTLNSGNNYEFLFVKTQFFPIYFTLNFSIDKGFFVFVFRYVLKLVSFNFIYVKDG